GKGEPPSLRCIRIGVGQMGEAWGLGGSAMHGDARRGLAMAAARKQHEERNEKRKGFQRRRGVAIDAYALQHGYQGSMARQGGKVGGAEYLAGNGGRSGAAPDGVTGSFRSLPSHVYASFQVLTL